MLKKKPESNCIIIQSNNINPIIDVTLWNGKINRLTKKFKYEKIIDDNETKEEIENEDEKIDENENDIENDQTKDENETK